MFKPHNARDIYKQHGHERGSLMCVEELAEELIGMRQALVAMAQSLDTMSNLMSNMIAVADVQQSIHKRILDTINKPGDNNA